MSDLGVFEIVWLLWPFREGVSDIVRVFVGLIVLYSLIMLGFL